MDVEQDKKKMVGKPTFPSVLLPDKQTSKWMFVFAALLLPLLHTSCDSKSQPLGREGGSCARQPQSRTTFTRKPAPPRDSSKLPPAYDLAPGQILLPSAFLYFCPQPSERLRTAANGTEQLNNDV